LLKFALTSRRLSIFTAQTTSLRAKELWGQAESAPV
jgi:hypothetical protein